MVEVVGIGTAVMDQLVNLPRLPQGEGMAQVEEVFHQGGGNAATAMAAVARLGGKAGMLVKVGGGATGDFIIKDFEYNGVDTSRILRGPPGTDSPYSIAVSELELGRRMFLIKPGSVGPLEVSELDFEYIAAAKILHLENGFPASMAAAKFAKDRGITVMIDAGDYSKDRVALSPYVDVFIGSELFYDGMFRGREDDLEGNCRRLRELGPAVVWITRGAKGCVGLVEGKFYDIPAIDSLPVKDTTGAGDVFHGAYIAAMLEGRSHPDCARYAGAVSAIKCMYVGGRTGIPNRGTLERFLQDGTVLTGEIEERLAYYRRNFPLA